MKFTVLTLFPEFIENSMHTSICKRAIENGYLELETCNFREYTENKNGRVDDYPYGGGAGMLIQAQPVYDAYMAVTGGKKVRTIYLTPQGEVFNQAKAHELAEEEELVFLCGHYEGIDERVLEKIVTDNVSIGDYVTTGGELPAMILIDAVSRLVPGVLHNEDSAGTESFSDGLLEYPQYSRPEEWMGKKVPEVLLSGHHANVEKWRLEKSLEETLKYRPDLYEKYMAEHPPKPAKKPRRKKVLAKPEDIC
jgi:tRNA (guanine37-N1)-methyltransferase